MAGLYDFNVNLFVSYLMGAGRSYYEDHVDEFLGMGSFEDVVRKLVDDNMDVMRILMRRYEGLGSAIRSHRVSVP